jgi:Domain of unknown function (DUF1772)
MVSAVSFCNAAYFTTSHSVRNLLLCTAGCSFLIVPYTLIAMLPVNNQLVEIYNSLRHNEKTDSNQRTLLEAQAVLRLDEWRKLHRVRLLLGVGSWIAGLVAFMIHV